MEHSQKKADSYGYVPFTVPKAAPIEQDIDPIGAANDVIQKLEAM